MPSFGRRYGRPHGGGGRRDGRWHGSGWRGDGWRDNWRGYGGYPRRYYGNVPRYPYYPSYYPAYPYNQVCLDRNRNGICDAYEYY